MRFRMVVRSCMVVRSRMVMQMTRHPCRGGGTQFQRKRHALGRHEAGRNIGTEQQQGQQQYAGP